MQNTHPRGRSSRRIDAGAFRGGRPPRQFNGLDAIVSNAGAVDPATLESMSLQVWDDMFALTCRASWLLAKAGFVHLKSQSRRLRRHLIAIRRPSTPANRSV